MKKEIKVKWAAHPEGSCCLQQSGIHCSLPSKLGRGTDSPDCKCVTSKDRHSPFPHRDFRQQNTPMEETPCSQSFTYLHIWNVRILTWKFDSVPDDNSVIHAAGCQPGIMRRPRDIHDICLKNPKRFHIRHWWQTEKIPLRNYYNLTRVEGEKEHSSSHWEWSSPTYNVQWGTKTKNPRQRMQCSVIIGNTNACIKYFVLFWMKKQQQLLQCTRFIPTHVKQSNCFQPWFWS